MPEPTNQSLFADITTQSGGAGGAGVLNVRLIGPSIGQREVPIIADLIASAMTEMSAGLRYLVLDMSQITFINSMGLGMCIDFRNRVNKLGGKTVLLGMNEQLSDLFKMVKVDRLYTIVKDRADLTQLINT